MPIRRMSLHLNHQSFVIASSTSHPCLLLSVDDTGRRQQQTKGGISQLPSYLGERGAIRDRSSLTSPERRYITVWLHVAGNPEGEGRLNFVFAASCGQCLPPSERFPWTFAQQCPNVGTSATTKFFWGFYSTKLINYKLFYFDLLEEALYLI